MWSLIVVTRLSTAIYKIIEPKESLSIKAIERFFQEVKKRSHKMAAAFRNKNSCLLLFYAVVRSLNLRNIADPTTGTKPLEFLQITIRLHRLMKPYRKEIFEFR